MDSKMRVQYLEVVSVRRLGPDSLDQSLHRQENQLQPAKHLHSRERDRWHQLSPQVPHME